MKKQKLKLIAGPCVIESEKILLKLQMNLRISVLL